MTTNTYEFIGWNQASLPVIVGPQPAGTLTLAQLADVNICTQLLPGLLALTAGRRQAALTLLHYALYTVNSLLLAPLVYDGVSLTTTAEQIGMTLDAGGNITSFWLAQVELVAPQQPIAEMGALAMRLLEPVAMAIRQVGKVSPRAVVNIALDALVAGCRRLERSCCDAPAADWIEELLAATNHPEYQPARPLLAYPDAGPAVTFYVRHTCCVLHKTPGPHACPACPQYPDDATRLQKINEWLGTLTDAHFQEVTGRARVIPPDARPAQPPAALATAVATART